jgi:hypothetical protein
MKTARQDDPGPLTALRLQLISASYAVIPVEGKRPAPKAWEQMLCASPQEIALWERAYPYAENTGILCRTTPVVDIDISQEAAARAIEDLAREHFEEHGNILVRFGRAPKRAIFLRTDEPFRKITGSIIAADGSEQKIEFLADGQQAVAFGIHPETQQAYRWFGGEPGPTPREDLPYVRETDAQRFIDDAVNLLIKEFGYTRASKRPKKEPKGNGRDDDDGGAADWKLLLDNIREGRALHDSLRDLAAKMIRSGTSPGATVNQLRALMEGSTAQRDARWKERYDEIPRLVESAEKFREQEAEDTAAAKASNLALCTIDETLVVFERWLILSDPTPVYAVLGTVAANLLPGDPVWLGLVGPPSSAKTEILNATSMLPHVVQAATLTAAALLSGVPKKQYDKGARGGLLRQIGDFGIIALKDFGSILSMHPETKAEVLAALREIYDGTWTRHLGTDGGKTLSWKGKLGLIFGATGVIDTHYAVIGAMGDRFLLSRLAPAGRGQFERALKHVGPATGRMRKELAEAVARLFAGRRPEPRAISDEEIQHIDRTISLVVRLRGAVERDRVSRELQAIYGAEGTARIGLALERLLAGLDTLGVERAKALDMVEAVALDSVPPTRRRAYEYLDAGKNAAASTTTVAEALALPTNTTRRVLEELAAYGLVTRTSQGAGKADLWARSPWDEERAL